MRSHKSARVFRVKRGRFIDARFWHVPDQALMASSYVVDCSFLPGDRKPWFEVSVNNVDTIIFGFFLVC
jgi:hypothetical protein